MLPWSLMEERRVHSVGGRAARVEGRCLWSLVEESQERRAGGGAGRVAAGFEWLQELRLASFS